MRLHPIHSRYIALLLLVAMLFTLLPAMQTPVSAMEEEDTPAFLDAKDDGVNMLNNGNNIAMSVKINNFGMDGLLFDYLSSFRSGENARHYLWESSGSSVNIQLYPYKTRADLGITLQNNDAQKLIFSDADGFGGGINPTYSLDATKTTSDVSGQHSNGSTYTRTLIPEVYKNLTEQVTAASQIALTDTPYVRLYPSGSKSGESYEKGRAWIKLTTFAQTRKVDEIRYVAIVYRLPHGTGNTSGYSNLGLTVNTMDETTANCSKFATVDPKGGETWQYAIIDLMGLGPNDSRRIASGSNVNTVYLQAPLHWAENNEIAIGSYAGTAANAAYMDIAAVGYFPYYGDAEQFAYYGLTLGSQQKYFSDDNAGFSLRNNTRTYDKTRPTNGNFVHIKSLPTFYTTQFVGARPFGVDTYDTNFYSDNVQDLSALTDVLGGYTDMDVQDLTGINLYGKIKGQAALGLVEPELNANGQPEYRESVVHYIAVFLRNQLLTIPEYPSDNGGWRNYSYITGSSTTGGTDEALFGKNELGQSIDLATALCNQIGVKKGAAITSGLGGFGNEANYDFSVVEDNCHIGTYAKTIAHKDELIGTWAECKENIHTWHDAAYYLLHNLYVTDTDVADMRVDGYGEYEDDYQTLIMPQVRYTEDGVTSTPYFFDSGYAYYTNKADAKTWSSAITMNKNDHTITLNADAQGVAQFQSEYTAAGQNPSSWFPFLPTSGNNPAGESNTPYYCHSGAFGRKDIGTTYKNRDFHYALSGVGSNLRIMTNMKIVESSLDVEKHAWQNGVKLMDNGLFDANEIVEYGFSITNNSEGKLYNLSFVDETIGIQMDSENGLTVTGNLTDALGAKLSPAGLVITVDGFDENGNQLDTVNVSCPNNDALIRFLQDLSAEGTQSGDSGDDYAQLYSGSGLWKDATVTVRGIHYRLTEQQKKINSIKNTVTGVAFMKTAGLGGGIEDRVLWGADINTLYQPGRPFYYQWAPNPIP